MSVLAIAFLAGALVVQQCADLPRWTPLLLAVCGGLALVPTLRRRLWLKIAAAAICGACWTCWRAELLLEQKLDVVFEGRTLEVVGDVVSIPEVSAGSSTQFDLRPLTGAHCESATAFSGCTSLPRRIRLSWYDARSVVRAGERWRLEVRLRQPKAFANQGGFDYEGQLFREGIGATGYVRSSERNVRLARRGEFAPVLGARAQIAERIAEVLGDSPASGVIAGLAVGATGSISSDYWSVFGATGTTHLVAISGLHVTMIALCAMALGGVLWRLLPQPAWCARQDFAALCGGVVALAYALLAGFSVPTQRTLVMLLVAMGAGVCRRHQPARSVLAAALLAVLIVDPHSALSPGFWLSFVAVAALMLALERTTSASPLGEFARTQAVVTVALVPVTLMLFGSVSLIAPLVNVVAIPLFTLGLVPLTLLGVVTGWLAPSAGDSLFVAAAGLFEFAWPLFEQAAQWPGALVHSPKLAPWLLGSMAVAALVVLAPVPGRLRVLALFVALPLLFGRNSTLREGELDTDVLDVGQGLAVVLRTRNHVLVYDTGPSFRSGRSAGDFAVVPFLRAHGVSFIDLLVLSHGDSDHAGGAGSLVQALPIGSMRTGDGRVTLAVPTAACSNGETWVWDGAQFEFIHPGDDENWRSNDGSCVLRARSAAGTLLLTGDIELKAEAQLLRRGADVSADVVVVPHHGSRSSSTQAFVDRVKPRWALISAGHANRWGFPHAAVVERWCRSGAKLLSTDRAGQISIRWRRPAPALEVVAFRPVNRRYWHWRSSDADAPRCDG